jgi:hypothetical protein
MSFSAIVDELHQANKKIIIGSLNKATNLLIKEKGKKKRNY